MTQIRNVRFDDHAPSSSRPYPVSFKCGQHLLSQFDLPRDLINAVAAAKEGLRSHKGVKQGENSEEEGYEAHNLMTVSEASSFS